MKKRARVAHWLFIICFPLLLLTTTVRLLVNSIHIYEYGFHRYAVSEVTGIDESQLRQVAIRLIDYFNSSVDTPQIKVVKDGKYVELFHHYELIHLNDVRALFRLDYLVQSAVLSYIVVYALLLSLWKKRGCQDLAKGIAQGCIVTLVIVALLGVISIFNFEWLFTQFHHIGFRNPYWMLDPSKDCLIMLFPPGFWQDVAIIAAGTIVVEAVLLGGLAWTAVFVSQRRTRLTKVDTDKKLRIPPISCRPFSDRQKST